MRIAVSFEKKGPAKYISHLDLQRSFGRAIRRSKLPVKFSEGFNPHYTVSFASALALGLESECECAEIVTTTDISPEVFLDKLKNALAPGIYAKKAVKLKDGAPKLMAALREAEYKAVIKNANIDKLKAAVCDIIDSKEIIAEKISKGKSKKIDIRSMIIMLGLEGENLRMRLAAAPSGSLKPELVIEELKKRAGSFEHSIVRTKLLTHIDEKAVDLLTALSES